MTTQGATSPGGGARVEEGAQGFLGQMAEKMGLAARHATIYGEPVTNGGVTVITVAKARWGFGGGSGSGTGPATRKGRHGSGDGPAQSDEALGSGEGSGGGGGVSISPVGYIEVSGDGARFHRIWDAQTIALLAVSSGFALALVLRSIRKIVR